MKRGPKDSRNGGKSTPRGEGGVPGQALGTGKHVCNPHESYHYAKGFTISQKDKGGYLRGIVYSLTLQFYAINYFFRPFDDKWVLFVVLCLFLILTTGYRCNANCHEGMTEKRGENVTG